MNRRVSGVGRCDSVACVRFLEFSITEKTKEEREGKKGRKEGESVCI